MERTRNERNNERSNINHSIIVIKALIKSNAQFYSHRFGLFVHYSTTDEFRKSIMQYTVCIILLFFAALSNGHFLSPAIISSDLGLKPDMIEYIAFPQSALKDTEVEIRLRCAEDVDLIFDVQFVIRSSPCDKEFFDINRLVQVKELLNFYFDHEYEIPDGYDYNEILFYKSKIQRFSCKDSHGVMLFDDQTPHVPMRVHNVVSVTPQRKIKMHADYGENLKPSDYILRSVSSIQEEEENCDFVGPRCASNKTMKKVAMSRTKREYAGVNGDSIDGGAKMSLSSWHPVQKFPVDVINFPSDRRSHNITIDVQWRGPYGYLSAIDYPLLRFYALMCIIYAILAILWLFMCLKHWKDILRIQFWIGAVIIIGMVEKTMFYSEYATMNMNGSTVDGFIEIIEIGHSIVMIVVIEL
ncbi:unnamed protein product [Dracunculus medinensis]|uniref:Transmembrane receptor, eukaryota n=1 Tax=Dracunculus medinensis TaxID=318479 RepID=A0A0N4UEP0_DRAME|nr:unnamed protein product [Dracunculus medinensis]